MPEQAPPAPRTLTEDEAYAIVADRVTRETAQLTDQVASLKRENADLASTLELAEAAKATELAGREKAEQDLANFKADTEREREIAARRDERTKQVREVASHLKDDFFTDTRTQRWAAMDDEAFATYVCELRDLSAGVSATTTTGAPRETAMRGQTPDAPAASGNGRRLFEIKRGA